MVRKSTQGHEKNTIKQKKENMKEVKKKQILKQLENEKQGPTNK